MRPPGLILAAPASSSGKTLVTLGLLRLLRRRGLRVAAAKAGPDYIDPTFHAAASGRPCLNLDPWAMRPGTIARELRVLESGADLVLCEGVMGLFDGTGASGEDGSTAALARLTGWPVVLIVDARGQGASVAALLRGFVEHDLAVRVAGAIFNRVSGTRHRALLDGAVARHLPHLALLGALPATPALTLPDRHLGLVPAGETDRCESLIEHAATIVDAACDVDSLIGVARPSSFCAAPEAGIPPLGQRVAIAQDDAFLFTYPGLLAEWRRRGAEIIPFAPLADQPPDPLADAIYLPGGYPELHAGRLAAAAAFLDGVRNGAAKGHAVYGECGGYMVLGDSLIDGDGARHRMAGLLPIATSFADRRLHLGYRSVTTIADGPFGSTGTVFRGHEFHYASEIAVGGRFGDPLFRVADAAGTDRGIAGLRRGSVAGSFIHLIDRAI